MSIFGRVLSLLASSLFILLAISTASSKFEFYVLVGISMILVILAQDKPHK